MRNTVREIQQLREHVRDRSAVVGAAVDDLLQTLRNSQAQAPKAKDVNAQAYAKVVEAIVKELIDLGADLINLKKLAWDKSIELNRLYTHLTKVLGDRRKENDELFRQRFGADRKTVNELLKLISPLDVDLKNLCEQLEGMVGDVRSASKTLAKALAKK